MKHNKWAEVLEKNYDALMTEAAEIGKMAIRNKHLRYIVQINLNGEIHSWYDVAGGNAVREDVFSGEAIEVFNICYQNLDECNYYKEEDEKNDGLNLEESMDEYIDDVEYYSYDATLSERLRMYANAGL